MGMWRIKEPVIIMSDFEFLSIFSALPDRGSCEYYAGVIKRVAK